VVRNYNSLIGRYPGADGMKTGFICASGFNLVATATRDNKQLIAVVLGAPSSAVRAVKAAEMLESGFAQNPLSWLTPSLGTVDDLKPIDAAPPNLKDQTCGRHRKRPATEEDDLDAGVVSGHGTGDSAENAQQFSVLLSALRAPTPKNANLLSDAGPVTPIVVYTGPTRTPAEMANLPADLVAEPVKKKSKRKAAAAPPAEVKPAAGKTSDKSTDGKTDAQGTTGKPSGSAVHWTPTSPSALAASPPPDLKADAAATPATAAAKPKKPKAQPAAAANPAPSQ
jgi:D-alanyl-D-alanine carboxypeptidase